MYLYNSCYTEEDSCMGMWPLSVYSGLCGSLSPVLSDWQEWVSEQWWHSLGGQGGPFFQDQVPEHQCAKGDMNLCVLLCSTHGLLISKMLFQCVKAALSMVLSLSILTRSFFCSLSLSHSVEGISLLVLWRSHLHTEHEDHSSVKHQSCSRHWTGVPLNIITYYSYINVGFQQHPLHTSCTLPYAHTSSWTSCVKQNTCKKIYSLYTCVQDSWSSF